MKLKPSNPFKVISIMMHEPNTKFSETIPKERDFRKVNKRLNKQEFSTYIGNLRKKAKKDNLTIYIETREPVSFKIHNKLETSQIKRFVYFAIIDNQINK